MKHLSKSLFLAALAASLIFFVSCTEDEEEVPDPPVVSFESAVLDLSGTATVKPGDVVSFVISVSAPAGFNNLKGSYFLGGDLVDEIQISKDPGTSPLTFTSDPFTFEIENEADGKTWAFEFQAVDDQNQSSNMLVLTADVNSPFAKVQTAVMLFAPDTDSLTKTFYSIADDTTYSITNINTTTEAISGTVDLGYFYGSEANLVSPSDYATLTGVYVNEIGAWGTTNSTSMVATDLTDLVEIKTVAGVELVIEEIDFEMDGVTTIEGIEADDMVNKIYAFKTANDLTGLFRVISILEGFQIGSEPNDPTVTGNIELEFILAVEE